MGDKMTDCLDSSRLWNVLKSQCNNALAVPFGTMITIIQSYSLYVLVFQFKISMQKLAIDLLVSLALNDLINSYGFIFVTKNSDNFRFDSI